MSKIPVLVAGAALVVAGWVGISTAQSSGRPVTGECDPPAADGSTDCLIHIAGVEVPPSTTVPATSEPSTTVVATTVPETDPPSTTLPPSTTTSSPSTTSAPSSTTSSTSSTTTSAPSTTTTVPPAEAAFSEDFSDPSSVSRFNLDVGNYVDSSGRRTADYIAQGGDTPRWTMGDHDMGCGAPTTLRQIDNADRNTATLNSRYFWYCAPNGPDTGHLMTGLDTTGYAVVSFSPKQTFTDVTRVCWDVNATDEGGGKWTNVVIVPEALYQRHAPRMDYVRFDFNAPNAPGDFNLQDGDNAGMKFLGVTDFRGTQFVYQSAQLLAHPGGDTAHVTTDKAARYRHCLERTGPSSARLTVARPDGPASVYNVGVGAAWPTGPVRVIFQDEMYDPPKREGYSPSHVSWHWDNLTIS